MECEEKHVMSARSTLLQATGRIALLLGALLLVTVLLAAIPSHQPPAVQSATPQALAPQETASANQESATQEMDHTTMPGMDMTDEQSSEKAAVSDMTHAHHGGGAHMTLTSMRPQTPEDVEHAKEIVAELRAGIEKYRDYRAALNSGYKIFLPNFPQPEYHFTNYVNGFLEAFTFDPARPTSLLYRKTATGYELLGAMYTMPKRATENQLNARVPLSVAMWHLHTNLCMPPRAQLRTADWTKFGLKGSIATHDACDAAGGRFRPSIFGWMVHVYPYEDSLDKIFAMHHHMD
jgi:hypothetical protein